MKVRRHVWRDLGLWAVLATPPLIAVTQSAAGFAFWGQLAGTVALAVAVGVCRRWPLAALLIVLGLTGVHGNFGFGIPVFAYLTGRRMEQARPVIWTFSGVFVAGSLSQLIQGVDVTEWFPLTIWLVLLGVLPWLVGRYWRQYTELIAAGWEQAEQLEREKQIIADRERIRERSRIAEDMHDSLGHELSLIALRAAALEVAPDLPERHQKAAGELRASAGEATERLREIIGVLRDASEAAPTRPAGESIADLVERARASGVAVELEMSGSDAPLMVDRAVHRLVQESLTNANKHAPGAAVTVRVENGAEETAVTVVNERPPAGPLPGRVQGRLGLTGLRERVRLTGGSFEAGATPDGGFKVGARLPHGASPAPADHSTASRLATGRRQVRKGLALAVAVPLGLVTVLGAIMGGYYAYATFNSVLKPDDYKRISVGQTRGELAPVLPRTVMLDPPPAASGPGCLAYRSDANLLGYDEVYRLCFTGDRLTSKNIVTSEGVKQ